MRLGLLLSVIVATAVVHAAILAMVVSRTVTETIEEQDGVSLGREIAQGIEREFGGTLFDALCRTGTRERAGENLLAMARQHGGFRVKVWDAAGVILWSDEPRLIGLSFPDNRHVPRALAGEVVSEIGPTAHGEHLYERGEAAFISETYVPIRSAGGPVQGLVEIYRHADAVVSAAAGARWTIYLGTAVVTLVLSVALGLLVGFSQRRVLRLRDELRLEKSKLDAVVEGVGVGLSLVDASHRVLWANRGIPSWRERGPSAVGRLCYDVFWGRSEPCEGCPSRQVFATGRAITVERSVASADGQECHFRVAVWPLRDRDGRVAHCLELTDDVTRWHGMQAQLQSAAAFAAVGEFAAGVAHEINNPMGVILASSSHLERTAAGPIREEISRIRAHAERVARIVKSLLTFPQRTTGEHRSIPVNTLVRECVAMLDHRFRGAHTGLRLDLAPGEPRVLANAGEILQVLLNLVNNALDAMPGGGEIAVSTREESGTVAIAVRDTGFGIPDADLKRIFDPFFTTKPAGKGTGLGLTVSRRIIEAHEGRIHVTSRVGEGSVFTLEIPAANGETT